MPSAKPSQAPAFDASAHEKALDAELKKGDSFVTIDGTKHTVQQGTEGYQIFQDKAFPLWKQWVESSGVYDGKGLRDVVNANATYLDQVKEDLDAHKAADLTRHQTINQRLSALEAAVQSPPFPG